MHILLRKLTNLHDITDEEQAALRMSNAQSFVQMKNERLERNMMSGSLLRRARAHQCIAPPKPVDLLEPSNLSNASNLYPRGLKR